MSSLELVRLGLAISASVAAIGGSIATSCVTHGESGPESTTSSVSTQLAMEAPSNAFTSPCAVSTPVVTEGPALDVPMALGAQGTESFASGLGALYHMVPVKIWNKAVSSRSIAPAATEARTNGASVHQYYRVGGKSTTWFLVYAGTWSGASYYQIRNGAGQLLLRDGQPNAVIHEGFYGASQLWRLEWDGTHYQVIARGSGKCLSNRNSTGDIYVDVCNGADYQKWGFSIAPDGNDVLMVKHSNKCARSITQAPGSYLYQYACNNPGTNIRFTFAEGTESGVKYHRLLSGGLCAEASGSQVTLQNCDTASLMQRWYFSASYSSDSYRYGDQTRIRNVGNNQCLGVYNAATTDGTALITEACSSTSDSQQWRVSGYSRRHVQLVQVTQNDHDEAKRGIIPDLDMVSLVARMNEVFSAYGINLAYDPATDKAALDDSEVWCWGNGSCLNGGADYDAIPHVNTIAASYPTKLVVFVRGFQAPASWQAGSGKQGFAGALSDGLVSQDRNPNSNPAQPDLVCNGSPLPDGGSSAGILDDFHVAHEFGHFLGLQHTFGGFYNSKADADAFLWSSGNNEILAWDPGTSTVGDGFSDTGPEPCIWPLVTQYCFSSATSYTYAKPDGGGAFQVPLTNIENYQYHSSKELSAAQTRAIRAALYARGMNTGIY